jgi:hypothetical protein
MPPEMTKFEQIRLEIERTLSKVEEAEGEDRRALLRRAHRLIILAEEAISSRDKPRPIADNPATDSD